jgi:hypothetical protein
MNACMLPAEHRPYPNPNPSTLQWVVWLSQNREGQREMKRARLHAGKLDEGQKRPSEKQIEAALRMQSSRERVDARLHPARTEAEQVRPLEASSAVSMHHWVDTSMR